MKSLLGILVLFLSLNVYSCLGQDKLSVLQYHRAIEYVKNDISRQQYANINNQCKSKKPNYKFNSVYISPTIIENNYGSVLCDILRKEYFIKNCAKHLGTNSELLKHVANSISIATVYTRDTHDYIRQISSKNEKGIILFFSNIEASTMTVERYMSCSSYKGVRYGSSKIYFFTFTGSVIQNVYTGEIRYNWLLQALSGGSPNFHTKCRRL